MPKIRKNEDSKEKVLRCLERDWNAQTFIYTADVINCIVLIDISILSHMNFINWNF